MALFGPDRTVPSLAQLWSVAENGTVSRPLKPPPRTARWYTSNTHRYHTYCFQRHMYRLRMCSLQADCTSNTTARPQPPVVADDVDLAELDEKERKTEAGELAGDKRWADGDDEYQGGRVR